MSSGASRSRRATMCPGGADGVSGLRLTPNLSSWLLCTPLSNLPLGRRWAIRATPDEGSTLLEIAELKLITSGLWSAAASSEGTTLLETAELKLITSDAQPAAASRC
eukprot:10989839-Karenia_brevis.AAC.1